VIRNAAVDVRRLLLEAVGLRACVSEQSNADTGNVGTDAAEDGLTVIVVEAVVRTIEAAGGKVAALFDPVAVDKAKAQIYGPTPRSSSRPRSYVMPAIR